MSNEVYPIHPAARIFPKMDKATFAALKDDIKRNGQNEDVILCDGQILDGRHRERACRELGIPCRTKTWEGGDPVAYVISCNLHRRHLTPGQRSMCAARARESYERQAKERQKEAGKTHGRGKEKVMVNLPQPNSDTGTTRDQVGKQFGVSGSSVDHATKVIDNAIPEVIAAVDEGRMAVSTAAILSTEPEEKQREEVQKPKRKRTYHTTSKQQTNGEAEKGEKDSPEGEVKGVGVFRAQEALNSLRRIPKNDPLRKRGFQIVTDWIRHNL